MGQVCSGPQTDNGNVIEESSIAKSEEVVNQAQADKEAAAAEEARKRAEEEEAAAKKKAAEEEEEARKKAEEEEAAKKKAEEEEAARIKAEEEAEAARKKAEEEEAAKKAAAEAAAKKEAEAKKKAAEDKKKKDELNKKLLAAVAKDDLNMVTTLLKKGADVECKGKDGRTPLIISSEGILAPEIEAGNGSKPSSGKVVEFLLSKGADVNAKGKDGKTALKVCCDTTSPSSKVAEPLLAKGAKLTEAEIKEVSKKFVTGIFKLLSAAKSSGSQAAFANAREAFPIESLRAWLKAGADVETLRDPSSNDTPLFLAVQCKRPDVVQLLVDSGANMKVQCGMQSATPLNMACNKGDVDSAKVLVDYAAKIGYDCEKEDSDSWSLWLDLKKKAGPRIR